MNEALNAVYEVRASGPLLLLIPPSVHPLPLYLYNTVTFLYSLLGCLLTDALSHVKVLNS